MRPPLFEHIRSVPVLRVLVFYLAGMFTGRLISLPVLFPAFIFLFFLFITVLGNFLRNAQLREMIFGQAFSVLFICMGMLQPGMVENSISDIKGRDIFVCEVVNFPLEKEKTWLVPVRLIGSLDSARYLKPGIHANIYIRKAGFHKDDFYPGKAILLDCELQRIRNPGNPDEFDYAGYLEKNGIFFTAVIDSSGVMPLPLTRKSLKYQATLLRNSVEMKIMSISGNQDKAGAVLIALGLGNKAGLDNEIKTDFSRAGAIHVMAVSGLHVGLIWMFAGFLTMFAGTSTGGRLFRFVFVFLLIWIYALITGLSPSVTRSCLMFSILGFGTLINRNSHGINSVILAAAIQLILNPEVISNLGFQFSYAAVISILLFQPAIRRIFPTGNRLVKYLADLLTVSLSAQVLTFPLVIYYFHSFPVYFFLTNMLIIPLVTLIMFLFVISSLLIFEPLIFSFLMTFCLKLVGILTFLVEKISSLPGAVLNDLHLNPMQAVLLTGLALMILVYRYYPKLNTLRAILLAITLFMIYGSMESFKRYNPSIRVFNIPGETGLDIYMLDNHYFFSGAEPDEKNIKYNCGNFWNSNYIGMPEYVNPGGEGTLPEDLHPVGLPGNGNQILHAGSMRIIFLNDSEELGKYETGSHIHSEIILLNHSSSAVFDAGISGMETKNLIVSGRVPVYMLKNMKAGSSAQVVQYPGLSGAINLSFTKKEIKKNMRSWQFGR